MAILFNLFLEHPLCESGYLIYFGKENQDAIVFWGGNPSLLNTAPFGRGLESAISMHRVLQSRDQRERSSLCFLAPAKITSIAIYPSPASRKNCADSSGGVGLM